MFLSNVFFCIGPGRMQRIGDVQYTFDGKHIAEKDINIRSYFPESWAFQEDYIE